MEASSERSAGRLFEALRQRAAEQTSQDRDVTGRVHGLRVGSHLHAKPDALELDPLAVGRPFNAPHQASELFRDPMDRGLEAAAGVAERAAVLDREVE
jgi:hypothetical protein